MDFFDNRCLLVSKFTEDHVPLCDEFGVNLSKTEILQKMCFQEEVINFVLEVFCSFLMDKIRNAFLNCIFLFLCCHMYL